MPELPEVETMVRGLRPVMEGRTLRRIRVLDAGLLAGCRRRVIEEFTRGTLVRAVSRRGKWVVIHLDGLAGCIVIQPRMTGGFWLVPPDRPEHVRVLFEVKGRRRPIWFCDTRRLGRIAWYHTDAEAEEAFARSHGPDALEIACDDLYARLRGTRRAVKPALIDQKLIAGIGNIYADEILFHAAINPQRTAARLVRAEVARLHEAIGHVLRAAIEAEGSSFDAGYRTVLGSEGGYLTQNAVYGREGKACPRCRGAIVRVRFKGLIGRSTYFCPQCQKRAKGELERLATEGC